MDTAPRSGKVVAGLLIALVVIPLLYLVSLQPTTYGPFVLVFLLTGLGVLIHQRRLRRAKGPKP
ncbi:MAG: hypothetical protein Q4P32_11745 [Micrococcales bacterium]|nr:hypothetical protein [Micrococcales bacterium]